MATRIYVEQIKNTLELESKKNKLVVLDIAPTVGAIKGLAQASKYQGAYPTAPTERVDGTALEVGDYYLNTTDGYVYYYEGPNVWKSPEKNSKESENNAASSEANAAASESAAANSASAALSSEQAAATSESNAASSEAAAATSESNAANSAASALSSEQSAAASEAAASVSEANAATSETNAAIHAANAEAAFDNFDDKYLGAKPSDPTTDNDGNPLQVGASYWNSSEDELRFWNGGVWDVPSETAVQAANTAVAARDAALIAEAAAEASETNAAASAASASTSESNAESAQSVASLAASSANTSANNAATSEANAATSETNAAQSAADAQQSADDAAAVVPNLQAQIDNRPTWGQVGLVKGSPYKAVGNALSGADSTTDLDTLVEPGFYSRIFNGPNKPSGFTGYWYIQVMKYASTGNTTQIAYPYGISGNAGTIAYRTRYGGVWESWKFVYSTGYKPTAQDVGAYTTTQTDSFVSGLQDQIDDRMTYDEVGLTKGNTDYTAVGNVDRGSAALDWDTLTNPGVHRRLAGVGSTNGPATNSPYYYVQVYRYASAAENLTQIAIPYGVASNQSYMSYRTRFNGVWHPWVTLYSTDHPPTPAEIGAYTVAQVDAIESALQSQIDSSSSALDTLDWKQFVRSEAELAQMREQNKSVRAASGFDHYGLQLEDADRNAINAGLWQSNTSGSLVMGRSSGSTHSGTSKTDFAVTHIAGFISEIVSNNGDASNVQSPIKFPEAPDGTVTYNSATGEVIQHADVATAFALADTSDDIEVVINRVDVFGAEFFLEEVSQANPYVYPKGMIQSQATSMNGITTTTSARPTTYYAVYDGDTGSQGLGVDFWAATDEQKKAMVSDKTNNIFMLNDGRLVQWRMRQRTIAGFGNGDWEELNPQSTAYLHFFGTFANNSVVNAQGMKDTVSNGSPTNVFDGALSSETSATKPETGLFSLRQSGDYELVAVDGECYFHVWGTVPRLNQGAYHPSFNPMGACAVGKVGAGGNSQEWFESDSVKGTSTLDFFLRVQDGGAKTNTSISGTIAGEAGRNGRPDRKHYDAIYASGQGGVIDYRLPSWDMSSKEEASKVFQKLVTGSYRGEEKLKYTIVRNQTFSDNSPTSSNLTFRFTSQHNLKVGDTIYSAPAANPEMYLQYPSRVVSITDDFTVVTAPAYSAEGGLHARGAYAICVETTDTSISDNFLAIDVFADPALILSNPDFSEGWLGTWAGIPGSAPNGNVSFTRKVVEDTPTRTYWISLSDAWSTGAMPNYNEQLNGSDSSWSSDSSLLYTFEYTAKAKLTKESNVNKVLNGFEGMRGVWAYGGFYRASNQWGVNLCESLSGKVGTSTTAGTGSSNLMLHKQTIVPSTQEVSTGTSWDNTTHSPFDLPAPTNDSSGMKALWYQSANSQQASLSFVWNEMKWVGSYADIGVVGISDGEVSSDGVAGTVYRTRFTEPTTGSVINNKLILCLNNFTASWNDAWVGRGTNSQGQQLYSYLSSPAGTPLMRDYGSQSDFWGDEGVIFVSDGTATYTNLNGALCLRGSSELAIPYGYTKNQARAGEQTEGVDL